MRRLAGRAAAKEKAGLSPALREEITARSRGNPLYVEEAVGFLAGARSEGDVSPALLPPSLPELPIWRNPWRRDACR